MPSGKGFWMWPRSSHTLICSVTTFSYLRNWHHHWGPWRCRHVALELEEQEGRDRLPQAFHWRIGTASAPPGPWAGTAAIAPNSSLLSETEWLHLHSDPVESEESQGSVKGEIQVVGRGKSLRQTVSYHNYKGMVFSLHVTEECWLQIRNKAGNYKLIFFFIFKTLIQQSQDSAPQSQQWHHALLGQSSQAARAIQQWPIHFSTKYNFQQNTAKINFLLFFFSSQVKTWSWTDRNFKKLRLILAV